MNIIFDLDSTLTTIEGIDELGAMKNLKKEISELTNRAMSGEITLEEVFEKRLKLIKPKLSDLYKLGELYTNNITPYAKDAIDILKKQHQVFILTGGYDIPTMAVAKKLEIKETNVFANKLIFDEFGNYQKIDKGIPLWQHNGKKRIVNRIKNNKEKTIMIGDGMGDAEANADIFIYFSGVIYRENVAKKADFVIQNLIDVIQFIHAL